MSQVEVILNMLRPIVTSMSAKEKSELLVQLSELFGNTEQLSASSSQHQENTLSGISFSSGNNNALNFSPIQNQGGNAETSYKLNQALDFGIDSQKLFEALAELKAKIYQDKTLNLSLKSSAEQQVDKLKEELKRTNPDPTLVERTVTLLKQGLEGVMTLSEPTVKVASLIAKLYGIPTL